MLIFFIDYVVCIDAPAIHIKKRPMSHLINDATWVLIIIATDIL